MEPNFLALTIIFTSIFVPPIIVFRFIFLGKAVERKTKVLFTVAVAWLILTLFGSLVISGSAKLPFLTAVNISVVFMYFILTYQRKIKHENVGDCFVASKYSTEKTVVRGFLIFVPGFTVLSLIWSIYGMAHNMEHILSNYKNLLNFSIYIKIAIFHFYYNDFLFCSLLFLSLYLFYKRYDRLRLCLIMAYSTQELLTAILMLYFTNNFTSSLSIINVGLPDLIVYIPILILYFTYLLTSKRFKNTFNVDTPSPLLSFKHENKTNSGENIPILTSNALNDFFSSYDNESVYLEINSMIKDNILSYSYEMFVERIETGVISSIKKYYYELKRIKIFLKNNLMTQDDYSRAIIKLLSVTKIKT